MRLLTLDYFTYRISLYAGMLAAAMGGIDGLVFTAGIGENAPTVREAVAERLAWLGSASISIESQMRAERC